MEVQIPLHDRSIMKGKRGGPLYCIWTLCHVLQCKNGCTDRIEMLFGMRNRVHGSREPWCAHWRHLANTIEPFVCCGDAALCEMTLTTCYTVVVIFVFHKKYIRTNRIYYVNSNSRVQWGGTTVALNKI